MWPHAIEVYRDMSLFTSASSSISILFFLLSYIPGTHSEISTQFQNNSSIISESGDQNHPTNEKHISVLSFEFNEDPETKNEDESLAKDSFWGRLYFNDFPQRKGVQYFRAHFGLEPPRGEITFLLKEPYNLCDSIVDDEVRGDGKKFLVAIRGECSFGEKVKVANEAGADGLVIVNNVVSFCC